MAFVSKFICCNCKWISLYLLSGCGFWRRHFMLKSVQCTLTVNVNAHVLIDSTLLKCPMLTKANRETNRIDWESNSDYAPNIHRKHTKITKFEEHEETKLNKRNEQTLRGHSFTHTSRLLLAVARNLLRCRNYGQFKYGALIVGLFKLFKGLL